MSVKLCIDCKYHRRDFPFFWCGKFATCAHPSVASLVDGKAIKYCDIMREYDSCGKGGNLWEAKKNG